MNVSNRHANPQSLRTRVVSWLSGATILFLYCSLSLVSLTFREVYRGFDHLPTLTKFMMAYGPIASPLFGMLGATAVIFAGRLGGRQILQGILFAIQIGALVLLVRSLMIGGIFISS